MEKSKTGERVDRFRSRSGSNINDDFVLTSAVPVIEVGHSTAGCPVTTSTGLWTSSAAIVSVASMISHELPPTPRMSPRSELRADILSTALVAKAGVFSAGMLAAMARNISDREQALKEQGLIGDSPLSPKEERDLNPLRHPRPDDDDENYDDEYDDYDDYDDDDVIDYDDYDDGDDDDDDDDYDDGDDDDDTDNENPIPKRLRPIIACVRCGGDHQAMDCPRSRDKPTSMNCLGAQPVNDSTCSVLKTAAVSRAATCPASSMEATAVAADCPSADCAKQPRKRRARGRGGRKKQAAIKLAARRAFEVSVAAGASVQSDARPRPAPSLEVIDTAATDVPPAVAAEQSQTWRGDGRKRPVITLAAQEVREVPAAPDASVQSEARSRLATAAAVLRAASRPAFRLEATNAPPAAVAEQPRPRRTTRRGGRRKRAAISLAMPEAHEAPAGPGASEQGTTATSELPLPVVYPDLSPLIQALIDTKRALRWRWQQTRCPRMKADLRMLANRVKAELEFHASASCRPAHRNAA